MSDVATHGPVFIIICEHYLINPGEILLSLLYTKPNLRAAPTSTLALGERYQVIHGEAVSIFDVSLNGFLIVTILVNLPLGLGGFVCRALQHLLDVLEAWLARKMFFLPFLGFFEMLLFFLSSWILGRRRTCPIHLRMRPRQRQNISRRSRLRQPMRMFLAQGHWHCGRS